MPREGHGSRNDLEQEFQFKKSPSCPARGMGVEMSLVFFNCSRLFVMPREGHGSRNLHNIDHIRLALSVMPREGHGSRNPKE